MPLAACALMLAATLAAEPGPAVVHLRAADVDAKMAAGGPATLLKADRYTVMMAERTKTGEAEVHAVDTDIIRVLAGTAVFVSGGTVVEPKTTAPNETRGPSIQGGDERRLAPGDIVMVPKGVPHWFKAVDGRVQYFVVKVVE
jgi:mannose-6-phosphate isomerase-like protein (cupin superfamily)